MVFVTVVNGSSSTPSSVPDTERTSTAPELQTCGRVLMVRPTSFFYNEETGASNAFQKRYVGDERALRQRVWREFDEAVQALDDHGVEVVLWEDRPDPPKPDAVFPNNWVSTHGDGTLVLYPLEAPVRRRERDPALVAWLLERTTPRRVLDLSELEREGAYLEGTGSLVLDRPSRTAYCAFSSRSHRRALDRWSAAMDYTVVSFHTDDGHALPVYHTNVVLSVGTRLAVLVEEALSVSEERRRVRACLEASGHEVVVIDRQAMRSMGANVLELQGREGSLWVLSTRAWSSLSAPARRALERDAYILPIDVTTIEDVGGGGVRCMLAELFLP